MRDYEKFSSIQKECAKELYNLFNEYILDNYLFLDIGCGTGFLSNFFSIRAFGLDINLNYLKLYEKNNKNKGVLGDIESLPFKSKSFDVVGSNFAIHLVNSFKALDEIVRVSKRYILLSLPVFPSLRGWIFEFPKKDNIIDFLFKKRVKILKEEMKTYSLSLKSEREFISFVNVTGKPSSKCGVYTIRHIRESLRNIEYYKFDVLFIVGEII